MKIRLFTILLAVFVLCNVASAQNYAIRTNNATNLRATYSLDGAILETVPSGTILQIVGKVNRWLKINRNGNAAWMADWVGYTHVASGTVGQSKRQTPQVDNCCFVDRQCNTDEEWTNGYWAYQNNQCGAPGQSQPQSSAQSTSSAPPQVDNCCFIDWQCNTDEEWTNGYWAYQNNQCGTPGQSIAGSLPRPLIEGAEDFVRRINRVFDLLEASSPEWYVFVVSGLNRIIEHQEFDRTYVFPSTGVLHIARPHAFFGNYRPDLLRTALVLVHEACHVHRHGTGLVAAGVEGESACLLKEIEAIETFDPHGRLEALTNWKRYLLDILSRIDDPSVQWWH